MNLDSLIYRHFIRLYQAVISQNPHALSGGFPKRLPESRMRPVVGFKRMDALHLNHKKDIGFITVIQAAHQFPDMLYAPFGGRVGEAGGTVLLQSHSFDFHKSLPPFCLQVKVKAGIFILIFRADQNFFCP